MSYSSSMKVEAIRSCGMSANFYQTTLDHIPEDSTSHNHHYENLKFNMINILLDLIICYRPINNSRYTTVTVNFQEGVSWKVAGLCMKVKCGGLWGQSCHMSGVWQFISNSSEFTIQLQSADLTAEIITGGQPMRMIQIDSVLQNTIWISTCLLIQTPQNCRSNVHVKWK
jgi:hypothetical protein